MTDGGPGTLMYVSASGCCRVRRLPAPWLGTQLGRSIWSLLLLTGFGAVPRDAAVAAAPPVTALAFAPDGTRVLAGSQSGLELRSWPELNRVGDLASELLHIHDIAFGPQGDRFLVAGGAPGEVGEVEERAWPSGTLLRRWAPHQDLVYAVDWSHDGRQWATASADHTCCIFDGRSGRIKHPLRGHSAAIMAIAFMPGSSMLVSGGIDQSLRVWDVATGRHIRSLTNHLGPVSDLAVRPNPPGEVPPYLASAGTDRTVRIWQPTIGRMVRFARLPSPALCVTWTHPPVRILVACQDGVLRVIDPESVAILQEETVLDGWVHSLAVSSDAETALVGGNRGMLRTARLAIRTRSELVP